MSTMAQRSASFQAVSASDAPLGGVPRIIRSNGLNRNITAVSDAAFSKLFAVRSAASRHLARLTPRQSQVLDLIVAGYASKNIAFELGISQRTVENHRAAIAKLTGARSLAALVHIAVCARYTWSANPSPNDLST
jgi:DNA-binding NarL/FixJ family response regulator